jgi:lipopolysaccharide export system protein LptA
VPLPSATTPSHAHLHRPGTDVDGDVFMGSLASDVFVLKGNVVLHSDPKIDQAIGDISKSDDPLTLTADEIDVDKTGATYVAKGHVHFVQGTRSGQADVATLNEQAHTIDLIGNANVLDGDHRAAAAKMHYNMLDKQFLGSGNVRLYEPVPTPNPNASGTPAPKKRKRRIPL